MSVISISWNVLPRNLHIQSRNAAYKQLTCLVIIIHIHTFIINYENRHRQTTKPAAEDFKKKLGILKLEDRIKLLEMNHEHKLFYGHLIWMKNLLKGQMYTHIGLANMTIASMFLRSIICHLLLSIIMGTPHGTHFLKKFYQSKIISKIQKGSLKVLLKFI